MAAYYIVDALGNVSAFPAGSVDLSNLDAGSLTSGTVPLARISGLTDAQIDAAAAIAWSKLSKSGSSLADLATRSAADLSSGSLAVARLGNGVTSTTTATDTGTVNDWAPTIAGNTYIAWSGASDATFTGLSSSGVTAGTVVVIKNTGTKNAFFSHADTGSATANRFTNLATSGKTPIAPGGHIAYVFDGTKWQLLSHEQGALISPAFDAAQYTGSGTITWTVIAGNVTTLAYRLSGVVLTVWVYIDGTTISGSGVALKIGNSQWGGFTVTKEQQTAGARDNDNGTRRAAFVQAPAGGTTINWYTDATAANAWAASTTNSGVVGTVTFEVS